MEAKKRYILTYLVDGEKKTSVTEGTTHREAMDAIRERFSSQEVSFTHWRDIEDVDTKGIYLKPR